jgi:WD40 repeat protein
MSRGTKIAASVAATAIGLVALAFVVGTRPDDMARAPRETATASTETSTATKIPVTASGAPTGDYVIDLSTREMTPLPKAIRSRRDVHLRGYAASPDGSRLAYVGAGDDGNAQIFIARIDGTGVHQATHDSREATSPAWSPDGTRVAYGAYGSGKVRNLYVLEVATGKRTQVTDGARDTWDAQFTTDGAALVFTQGPNCCPRLRTVPVTGGKSSILIRPEPGLPDSGNGSLSPDGSLVTFLGGGTPPSGNPGHCGPCRWVANADGTDRRVIPGWYVNPAGAWSPDGSRIVESRDDNGIVVVDISTGHASLVAKGRSAIWLDRHTLLVGV